jgi:hypothetical protein
MPTSSCEPLHTRRTGMIVARHYDKLFHNLLPR